MIERGPGGGRRIATAGIWLMLVVVVVVVACVIDGGINEIGGTCI